MSIDKLLGYYVIVRNDDERNNIGNKWKMGQLTEFHPVDIDLDDWKSIESITFKSKT